MTFHHTTLFEGSSELGTYKVVDTIYDGRPARILYGNRQSPQSGMATDDDPELLFNYNQRFLEMIESRRPKHILLIGGGVFMLPKAVLERFNDIRIDVVEIDSLLPELARQYFKLEDDPRLKIIIADGRDYVTNSTDTYDMIILDAFSGYDIPYSLLTREAVSLYKQHLTINGFMTINFISEYRTFRQRLTHELIATFGEQFNAVALYQADHLFPSKAEQNLMLVASPTPIDFDYLQSVAVEAAYMPENAILLDQ